MVCKILQAKKYCIYSILYLFCFRCLRLFGRVSTTSCKNFLQAALETKSSLQEEEALPGHKGPVILYMPEEEVLRHALHAM